MTDNLLSIAKHQNLNLKYMKFMTIDIEEEKKKQFKRHRVEAREKTQFGEKFIQTVLDEARRNAKLESDEMFIANRMKEIVVKADSRVHDIVQSHKKVYLHSDLLFKKDASLLKRPRTRPSSIDVVEGAEMCEFLEDDDLQVSKPKKTKLRTKSAHYWRNTLEQKRLLE